MGRVEVWRDVARVKIAAAGGWWSTRDQHPEAQRDALGAAGFEQISLDTVSGKLARRAELD